MNRSGEQFARAIVAPLTDGSTMTGAVKWARAPIGAQVHHEHCDMLARAAEAGRVWAYSALEPKSPFYYVAAGGSSAGFRKAAAASGHPLILWSLEDLYRD